MALLKESKLREIADQEIRKSKVYSQINREMIKNAMLNESSKQFTFEKKYDIFLSHSYLDKDLIIGLSKYLESFGYSVYIDWIEDSKLDRSDVSVKNVEILRQRMSSSNCLLYAFSENALLSKWMPWELGFMDGFTNKVVICPIVTSSLTNYLGTEYLGIYPFIDEAKSNSNDNIILWVTDQNNEKLYISFSNWLKGRNLIVHD